VTLHERQLDLAPHAGYAADRGVLLIPGIERTIEGKHVLLLNFEGGTEAVDTFEDLARLKASSNGLVVAPHPFFPGASCLHSRLEQYAALFDAVEWNGMFTAALNFNRKAEQWARAHGKPMVGNGDVHRLDQLGTTWSSVDAEPTADAICAAIRGGAVRVEATPHSWLRASLIAADLLTMELRRGLAPSRPRSVAAQVT
jgi:predicted metal-dependent phosphoesterase TrpH